jgi:hypothetical protein
MKEFGNSLAVEDQADLPSSTVFSAASFTGRELLTSLQTHLDLIGEWEVDEKIAEAAASNQLRV